MVEKVQVQRFGFEEMLQQNRCLEKRDGVLDEPPAAEKGAAVFSVAPPSRSCSGRLPPHAALINACAAQISPSWACHSSLLFVPVNTDHRA
jgi:hypothetical protein